MEKTVSPKDKYVGEYNKKGEKLDWGVSWSSLKQIDDDDLYWSRIGSKKAKLVELLNKYQIIQF